uniref:Uncharacterized protein n=1 Tax=Rhizophora mucronata TaxID=61149 RepID=A0A2P2MLV6_RHIMU
MTLDTTILKVKEQFTLTARHAQMLHLPSQ